jgi:hypothetical protein
MVSLIRSWDADPSARYQADILDARQHLVALLPPGQP